MSRPDAMEGAQGRALVSTSPPLSAGASSRRVLGFARRSVPWLMWLGPVVLAAVTLSFLASEVAQAPFRLSVRTNLFWFVVESGDAELALDAAVWQLDRPSDIEEPRIASGDRTVIAIRNASVAPAQQGNTLARLMMHPAAGDLLRFTMTPGATPRLTVGSRENPVNVSIERLDAGSDGHLGFVAESEKQPPVTGETRSILAKFGGSEGSQVTGVSPTTSTNRSTRVKVRQFGFSTSGDVLVSGVTGGELYFLDVPSLEMKVFRGTDLRVAGDSLNLDALSVRPDGLEVTLSGMARTAALTIGADQRPYSLMPTNLDRAQRRPWMIGSIGALGVLISLFGLMFAGAGMFRRFASWIGAPPPEGLKR